MTPSYSQQQELIELAETAMRERGLWPDFSSAAEEQSTVAEQININITRISDVSMQTSSGASQTAEMAAELARLAAELQRLVAKFNLGARF